MKRSTTLGTALCLAAIAVAGPAAAHPLGNFTINHLTAIAVHPRRVDVRYVLDLAEIPTYEIMRERSASATMTAAERAAWAGGEARRLLPELDLRIDGERAPLVVDRAASRTRAGAGGLPLLYLVVDAHAPLAARARVARISFHDRTFPGRIGWKDVVVAPATEPTGELLHYPNALLGSPRDRTGVVAIRDAAGTFVAQSTDVRTAVVASSPSAVRSNVLSDMLAKGTRDPQFVLLTLLVAIALGALHALEPGHGKTLLAVSLVGARATVGQAAILAGSLTVAHTIGVIVFGFAIELLKGAFVPEAIYPWITLVSGVAIAVIGARSVARAVAHRLPFAHAHVHAHDGAHDHDHDHDHDPHGDAHGDDDHARAHAMPGTAPLKFGATVWAAMSGGIAPCPAALVVLLAALALDRVGYGIVVIVAFSIGLAVTLTGLGIGVVRGAALLSRFSAFDRVVRVGPLLSAIVIATIGSIMVGQGMAAQDIAVPWFVVSVVTAIAIAGYAFSRPGAHAREMEIA